MVAGLASESIVELGEIAAGSAVGRIDDDITVVDLTGLAVEDVVVAEIVLRGLTGR